MTARCLFGGRNFRGWPQHSRKPVRPMREKPGAVRSAGRGWWVPAPPWTLPRGGTSSDRPVPHGRGPPTARSRSLRRGCSGKGSCREAVLGKVPREGGEWSWHQVAPSGTLWHLMHTNFLSPSASRGYRCHFDFNLGCHFVAPKWHPVAPCGTLRLFPPHATAQAQPFGPFPRANGCAHGVGSGGVRCRRHARPHFLASDFGRPGEVALPKQRPPALPLVAAPEPLPPHRQVR
jgi:hypothetical protein